MICCHGYTRFNNLSTSIKTDFKLLKPVYLNDYSVGMSSLLDCYRSSVWICTEIKDASKLVICLTKHCTLHEDESPRNEILMT